MKNLALLILSIGAMNLASFTNDESFFDQMNDVNLIEDNMMVKYDHTNHTLYKGGASKDGSYYCIYQANGYKKFLDGS